MNKILKLALLAVMVLFLGCSDRKISTVKNGVLEFDKALTVGEAFDNYKYCKDVKWESFETDNGRNVVQVTCDYDLNNKDNSKNTVELFKQKGVSKVEIIYQFEILKSDPKKFEMVGEFPKVYDKNGKVIYEENKASVDDSLPDLKHIYENEPLL